MYAAQAKARKIDGTFKPLATHPRPSLIAIDAATLRLSGDRAG